MDYFKNYVSNTVGASANQHYFSMDGNEIRTGRIFYKIFAPGKYNYSLLFSNIIDSTYADGSISHKNLICDSWVIHNARIGRCRSFDKTKELSQLKMDEDIVVTDFKELSFNSKSSKNVMPGEFFASDPIEFCFEEDEYLCFEITFSGKMIPYHEETILPVYVKEDVKWQYLQKMPLPAMIGCDRKVSAKIGFLGDSITQGIGPQFNSYLHWSALLPEKIGRKYAYWNLGIGYGRANDAGSDGAWLYKAKQNDMLFVCYGVNDLFQNQPEEQIITDLTNIVNILKKQNIKVILQTIPPFDYSGETIKKWERINLYIKEVLSKKVDALFDIAPHLAEEVTPHMAKYGGHPNALGSKIWADALYEYISYMFN